MIIILDFDGVLHGDAVFRPRNKPLELRAEGSLMMHSHILEVILEPYHEAKIILATSWVRELGYDRTLSKMTPNLRERVVGATWHKAMRANGRDTDPFSWMTRYQQIESHVKRNGIENWLAIDDLHSANEVDRWPENMRNRLVLTDGVNGLGCIEAQADLKVKL